MNDSVTDPSKFWALAPDADAQLIRQTYLAAVKRYPPDKEPDKFRQIHKAYQMLEDPLVQADAILQAIYHPAAPEEVIERATRTSPRLPTRTSWHSAIRPFNRSHRRQTADR